MVAFIETMADSQLAGKLEHAIQGKGAFRRFKDMLNRYPKEIDHWYQFQQERETQRMTAWLNRHDIEPIFD